MDEKGPHPGKKPPKGANPPGKSSVVAPPVVLGLAEVLGPGAQNLHPMKAELADLLLQKGRLPLVCLHDGQEKMGSQNFQGKSGNASARAHVHSSARSRGLPEIQKLSRLNKKCFQDLLWVSNASQPDALIPPTDPFEEGGELLFLL